MGGVEPTTWLALDHDGTEPIAARYFAQDGVHEIYRDWHKVLEEYEGDRVLCGEAWVEPLEKLARWVRPDEMQQTFNFGYLETPWDARRSAHRDRPVDLAAASVGAPSTWVLSNHDVVRHRLAAARPENLRGPRHPRR